MADSDPLFQRNLKRFANAAKDSEFSVVSYNILCDAVFDKNPRLYSYLPDEMKCRGPAPRNCVRHTQLVKEVQRLFTLIEIYYERNLLTLFMSCRYGFTYE